MPALPTVTKCIRCAVRCTLGIDTDVVSIFHVIAADAGPYTSATLSNVAGEVGSDFATKFLPDLSQDVVYRDCTAKDLSVIDGNIGISVVDSGTAGGTAHPSIGASSAALISWKEGISYRGGHARTYLPGVPQAYLADAQHMIPALASALQADANAFLASVNASSPTGAGALTLSVVHYRLNDTPQTPPLVESIITGVAEAQLASQRRRNAR